VSKSASTSVALAIAVIFMLVVAFNAEKARINARRGATVIGDPAAGEAPGAPDHADSVS
jgi:hypothetical protein